MTSTGDPHNLASEMFTAQITLSLDPEKDLLHSWGAMVLLVTSLFFTEIFVILLDLAQMIRAD